MIRRISLIGTIFFLFSMCVSPPAAQEFRESYSPNEERLYPFTLLELEAFPYEQGATSSIGGGFCFPYSDAKGPSIKTSGLPPRDELGIDFNLDFLVGHQNKSEPEFDIPIVFNAKVLQFIQYFQTDIRDRFATYLGRSEKYIRFMRNLLKEYGLPEDLVYIVLIESGFDPSAYSRSKASGPWQFVYWTGRRYGLKVNWWVDERRDPVKSTIAAAKYLKDLYERFESWHLVAAGYNAGEYKIVKAIKRSRTEDFWKLTNHPYLKRETKNYVPQMIAAALIAKDPGSYGFTDIEYEEPLCYEEVRVPELTGLSLIAKACETTLEEIKGLNPEILRGVTPPNEAEYEIKIPLGKKEVFLKNFEALQPLEKFEFKTHILKNGETLAGVAKRYRVDLEPLLEINQLRKTSRVSKGTTLLIPIGKDEEIKPIMVAQKKNGKGRNGKSSK